MTDGVICQMALMEHSVASVCEGFFFILKKELETKEIGLEVNANKTKYMVMSREQIAGLNHTMKVDNSSIERVEEFKYLGTMLTNQNSVQE